jgi:hypothetical protein
MAASQRATAAAEQAASAADAALAAINAIRESGLQLPEEMLQAIGGSASQAWEARMREIGALVDDGGATAATGIVPDPTAAAAKAADAVTAAATGVVAAAAESADDIIYPTFAHKALRQGVRRGDWGK